jgi:ATP-binding cassette subfamily C protein CydD
MKPQTPSRWLMSQKKLAQPWAQTCVILGLLNVLLLIIQLHWIALLIEHVFLQGANQKAIFAGLCLILGLIGLRAIVAGLKEFCGFKAGALIRQNLRMQIIQQLEKLGPILGKQKQSGAWLSAALEQIEALQSFFAQYLPQMSLCVLAPLMIVGVVFWLNWLAGLILLIAAPLIPLFMALVGMGAASINQKNFQALARMSSHFLDVLQGLNTLKLFDRSRAETAKIYAVSEAYRKTTMQTLRIAFLSSGVLEFFAACSIALLATYLGLSLLHAIHIGQPLNLYRALLILLLAPEFFLPLRELSAYYHAKAAAVGAAEELTPLLLQPPSSATSPNLMSVDSDAPYAIDCQQLVFTYPQNMTPTLNQFSLQVKPAEHIAIIGKSGCGKSTLLHLLLGFLTPTAGNIICKSPLHKIGWLSQQPMLFRGTLRSNLLLANPDATEDDLWQALQQAAIKATVQSLPLGLDTKIGEQNQGISGGQAQRIALARLYLQNPDIVLLDEPTAHLDTENALAILDSIQQYTQDKTLILVTHRLEPLLNMDRVVTL